MKLDQETEKKTENTSQNSKVIDRVKMRKKMIMVFGGIVGGVLVLLLVLFLISLLTTKKYSYYEIEDIMKDAAVEYYKAHKGRLPDNDEVVEAVDDDILVRNEYMKPLSKYLKEGVHCLGKVEVDYNNGDYLYTPYLECGKAYSTVELYKKVERKSNIVTQGYGLYQLNNEYVYRGEEVANYITLDGKTDENSLWRIVKFTKDGDAVLIKEKADSYSWDDRFNSTTSYRTGINDYAVSRIKDDLKKLYYLNDEDDGILTDKARKKLVSFSHCSGKRAKDYVNNDNSAECSVMTEKVKIALLTVSDYLNASVDTNCTSVFSKACQNYNYLKVKYNWWLATASLENTVDVYYVRSSGYLDTTDASGFNFVRPVVHLSHKAMYDGGNGTITNPYKIR